MCAQRHGAILQLSRQMCGSGLGFAILPELYLRSEVGGENMVTRLRPEGWAAARSIAAVWREGAAFADNYRLIADVVVEQARRILAGPLDS
jgi:LysR family hydrogen peroxide-inducible transcriptional activator